MFDSQDYGGAIDKSQADQFLPPGGSDVMLDSTPSIEVEDNTELLTLVFTKRILFHNEADELSLKHFSLINDFNSKYKYNNFK